MAPILKRPPAAQAVSPGPQCSDRYPAGQCTAGAAVMFPAVCQAPNLGNGGQWYGNAAAFGWPHEPGAHVGWLASFNVDPPYGDVGLITAINGDGTLQRWGVNWHLDGQWSSDRVPVDVVIGSFLPPGTFVNTATGVSEQVSPGQTVPASGARGLACQFGWETPNLSLGPVSLGRQSICFDGLVGVLAWGAGAAMLLMAVVILARKPLERAGGRAGQAAGTVTTVAGTVTAQPEVVAAGTAVRGAGTALRRRGERPRQPRSRSLSRAGSVQEQETYRNVRATGYSPVQSRRAAQAAGSVGTREERLSRALQYLGQESQ